MHSQHFASYGIPIVLIANAPTQGETLGGMYPTNPIWGRLDRSTKGLMILKCRVTLVFDGSPTDSRLPQGPGKYLSRHACLQYAQSAIS